MYINLLRQRYILHNLNIGQRQSNNSYCRDNKIHFINKTPACKNLLRYTKWFYHIVI